jgi:general secretion pathway protein J
MRQRGFTLVELLVALMVMALLSVLSWRGLDGMARATAITQSRADELVALQNGMAQFGADLDAMVDLAQTAAPAVNGGSMEAAPKLNVSNASKPVSLDWNGQVLRIVRASGAAGESGLRVVAWSRRLMPAQDASQGQWLRWQSELLHNPVDLQVSWSQAAIWAQSPDDAARKREVAVVPLGDWSIYFFRNDAWSNPMSSADAANATPDGVRLVLTLPEGSVLAGVITRDWIRPTVAGNKS